DTMSTTQEQKHPEDTNSLPTTTTKTTSQWETPLIQCFPCGPFWKAIFCPCIFYGQTAQRLRDPNLPAEKHNADCTDFAMNNLLLSIDIMTHRAEIRKRYNIPGSQTKDCLVSCFCCSCAVVQQDEEVRGRQEREGIRVGYKAEAPMMVNGGETERRGERRGGVLQV
ncbi:PLAC8 family-domain-containing protein, partial [Cercophora samala]